MNSFFEISNPFGWTLSIPAYALFACIGLFCMMLLLYFRVEKLDMSFSSFLAAIFFMAVGVGIGSKFLFILTKIPDIVTNFSMQYLLDTIAVSGIVFYGGLFGAIVGMFLYAKRKKIEVKVFANTVAPCFPLFHMWGRIGCFFSGCCYGKAADWGIAMEFEPDTLRIPIQLIESFFVFLIFLLLLLAEYKFREHDNLLYIYLFLYAIVRVILEFFRDDAVRGIWFGVSTSQWISLFIIFYLLFMRKGMIRGLSTGRKPKGGEGNGKNTPK